MSLSKDEKETIIQEYHVHQGDTGSPEVQVALLTTRINALIEHLKIHKHDHALAAWLVEDGRPTPTAPGVSEPEGPGIAIAS